MNHSDELSLSAPAWSADWLNGWMAAIGVLWNDRLRLHFTRTPLPVPVFTSRDGGVVTWRDIASSVPTREELDSSVIARRLVGFDEFPRNPSAESYAERARRARHTGDPMLGSTVTDMVEGFLNEGKLEHSPFDASVPRGITLWQRAVSVIEAIDDPQTVVERSASGTLPRSKQNGLGFDARRIVIASATDTEKYVDPVVEALVYRAIPMFPTAGRGGVSPMTRGWRSRPTVPGAFTWPVWGQPLDWAAVDCLLGAFWAGRPVGTADASPVWQRNTERIGVFGAFESVPYRPTGTSDTTRGYSSRLAWMSL